jgi:hypothetical protein
MHILTSFLLGLTHWGMVFLLACAAGPHVHGAVLQQSDVVFMYQVKPEIYAAYGATVLAWGGKPTPTSLADANGVKFFGSVGMVTEFARYYERFPQTYEAGLCRDLEGKPVKVPWLTDHQHKGIPYWWCCTRQPQFRQYLSERVAETIQAGAEGLHIDDHLGTAGGLWLGICFCDRCVEGFRACLKTLSPEELTLLGITHAETFDFREAAKQWLAASPNKKRTVTQHPLWPRWTIYQCRAAAAFMRELHQLADKTAGRPVPMGANAGLLWPRHLIDYKTLDLFSAETDHHAQQERFSDLPLVAYRLADAVGRPYAATASGGDWAYIKERNLPGLVRGWIALSYAAGHCLMAPHRQWCYTPQKGTHWYQGPTEKFAPLYQFVRRNAGLFDGYENHADLAVVVPHRAFAQQPNRWFEICNQLAATNVSYRLLLAGDEIVDHPLAAAELQSARVLLVPEEENLLPADRERLRLVAKDKQAFKSVREALAAVSPAVRVRAEGVVRVLPRVKPGSAALHVLNYDYESARDDVRPLEHVKIIIDTKALGLPRITTCKFYTPDAPPVTLPVDGDTVEVPVLGLWGVLVL